MPKNFKNGYRTAGEPRGNPGEPLALCIFDTFIFAASRTLFFRFLLLPSHSSPFRVLAPFLSFPSALLLEAFSAFPRSRSFHHLVVFALGALRPVLTLSYGFLAASPPLASAWPTIPGRCLPRYTWAHGGFAAIPLRFAGTYIGFQDPPKRSYALLS